MFTIDVQEDEKVLLYKKEKFVKVLDVGVHTLFDPLRNYKVERVSTAKYGLGTLKSEVMLKNYPELCNEYFQVVELDEAERAFVWAEGNFLELLEAGASKLYFKSVDLRIEKINVKETKRVAKEHMKYIDMIGNPTGIKNR